MSSAAGSCMQMIRRICVSLITTLAVALLGTSAAYSQTRPEPAQSPPQRSVSLPVAFEENRGQFDPAVAYSARVGDRRLAVGDDGSVTIADCRTQSATRIHLVAARHDRVLPLDRLPAEVRYLHSNRPERWIQNVPLYRRVRLPNVYPGIDWEWKPSGQTIEYDFIVQPGANPRQIVLQFARSARLRSVHGDLHVIDDDGETVHGRPVAFQTIGGR